MPSASWPSSITIPTATKPVRGNIRPPGSKSITNRALICAALASGASRLIGALDSEDTRVMLDSLAKLGFEVEANLDAADHADRVITIHGQGGKIPDASADLFIANSGTSVRFLTAFVATGQGVYRLDGTERMRERPIQDLLESLQNLGVDARSVPGTGCPPVEVRACGLNGGKVKIRGDISSQFLSGLLLAAPNATSPMTIEVEGKLVSQPYVKITLEVMRAFGVDVETEATLHLHDSKQSGVIPPAPTYAVPQKKYRGCEYQIEPDASAASYWFAAAAVTGGEVTVEHLHRESLQGDVGFVETLRAMGCEVEYNENSITVRGGKLRGIEVDMNAISDTVQTLAVVTLFADGPTTITGVEHNRYKETDRIGNLAIELRKLGATVEDFRDGLKIIPDPTRGASALHGAELETYNDHRMAMSFSIAGLRIPNVTVLNPKCVEKTYPEFFEDLKRMLG